MNGRQLQKSLFCQYLTKNLEWEVGTAHLRCSMHQIQSNGKIWQPNYQQFLRYGHTCWLTDTKNINLPTSHQELGMGNWHPSFVLFPAPNWSNKLCILTGQNCWVSPLPLFFGLVWSHCNLGQLTMHLNSPKLLSLSTTPIFMLSLEPLTTPCCCWWRQQVENFCQWLFGPYSYIDCETLTTLQW